MTLKYEPNIFAVTNQQDAKDIILTFEDEPTNVRWETETPYLMELIDAKFSLGNQSAILDFGTGIGRMPKELIDKYECLCVGADISPHMRALSIPYVNRDLFVPISNPALLRLNMKFDLILAIWVLQHCYAVRTDIDVLASLLKPGGALFVVNNCQRVVPCMNDDKFMWIDDKVDLADMLHRHPELKTREVAKLDAKVGEKLSQRTFYGIYTKS